jgi:hypothetical protein
MPNPVTLSLPRGSWQQVLTSQYAAANGLGSISTGSPERRPSEAAAPLAAAEEDEGEVSRAHLLKAACSPIAPVQSAHSVAGGAP